MHNLTPSRNILRSPQTRLWTRLIAIISLTFAWMSGLAWAQDETSPPAGNITPIEIQSIPAGRQADRVCIITVEGPIDRVTAMSVKRRIEAAEKAGFDAIVLEVHSPGGELYSCLEISNYLKGSGIPNTVAWVNRDAYSGGAIISLACGEIVTNEPASFGDALIIDTITGQMRTLTPEQRTKLLPPLMMDVVDSARRSGYDEFLVQAIVTDGIELWQVEDISTGELLMISENEYGYLFDDEPIRGRPMLSQVTGGVQTYSDKPSNDSEQSSEQGDDMPLDAEAVDAEQSSDTPSDDETSEPVDDLDPNRYRPASDTLHDVEKALKKREADSTKQVVTLSTPSSRRLITPADKGRYRLVGYVTDGSSAIVMRDQEMIDFGLSSGIVRDDAELEAFFGAKEMVRLNETAMDKLIRFLLHPTIRFVFMAIFLIAIFVELITAGTGIAGAVALGALALMFGPSVLIGMSGWWEFAAIIIGILCLVIEAFVIPGFGIFGVIGIISLFVGLIGTFVTSGGTMSTPELQRQLLTGSVTVLLAFVTAGIGWWLIIRNAQNLPLFEKLILSSASGVGGTPQKSMLHAIVMDDGSVRVGSEGLTTTPLYPIGQADFDGQLEDVYAAFGSIEKGVRVRVVQATKMRIEVEEIIEEQAGTTDPTEETEKA